ncbi:MAG TPA: hypothetical protein VGW38_21720 [Chloroflexota bacterium]|nr:hypothetical protein [Chloroflexota bacterium]
MDEGVELLEYGGNFSVARHTQRTFPGVLIQGDTLSTWWSDLERILNALANNDIDDATETARWLLEHVDGALRFYERVLGDHGIRLPYNERR